MGPTTGVVPAALRVGTSPAAVVFARVRNAGPVTRDRLASSTDLSTATVNRQVHALTQAGLVVERPDLVDGGGIGRPKVPLALNHDGLAVAAMHIGARRTLLAVADLSGRTLYSHAVLTPAGGAEEAVAELAGALRELVGRFSGRRFCWAGVAVGGDVDETTGTVDHPVRGWRSAPVGKIVHEVLGLPVSVCEHVQAMAAAELVLAPSASPDLRAPGRSSVYWYARETVGMALTVDGHVHVPRTGAGTVAHIPVRAPRFAGDTDGVGLQQVIGSAVLHEAAQRHGLAVDSSELLDERARALGEAIATIGDALNPDAIIVAGDAFAEHPRGLAPVQAAFDEARHLPHRLELTPTQFGLGVQEAAAVVVALSVIYADPITSLAE
ncbi:putative NagC family transcriptional regulator [Gordonia araii NBRC 100433]|uniref:Putative NagC family transcriptional regulator n=1 Tax=Gordonia araii NBRC 100433 TaxID=1073574 RepID=G7H718_9ACTN|nr:ROK family transcriptional regulator [Gordonia araii]NNG97639.1 ROK family protein [Gordonia araii NBRC 100433]GAB11643.1 putative NagC family transcriptional regulator [Gordonia araii NBRC 100433]